MTALTASYDARRKDGALIAYLVAGPARVLLAAIGEAVVTLSDGPEPLGRIFRRFLEAQPQAVLLSEVSPSGPVEGDSVHLLAALGKAIWKTPQRQAQIDTIESKVNALLAELRK